MAKPNTKKKPKIDLLTFLKSRTEKTPKKVKK